MNKQPTIEDVKFKMDLVREKITELENDPLWDNDEEFREKMLLDLNLMLLKGEQWLKENKPSEKIKCKCACHSNPNVKHIQECCENGYVTSTDFIIK